MEPVGEDRRLNIIGGRNFPPGKRNDVPRALPREGSARGVRRHWNFFNPGRAIQNPVKVSAGPGTARKCHRNLRVDVQRNQPRWHAYIAHKDIDAI
jgi:hypothetical protein